MNVVPVMLKKVNGYTTGTIKRGADRFFVASNEKVLKNMPKH